MTGVDKLHAENITGKGVKVAILDTGVDYLNLALGGGFGPGFKVVGGADLVGDLYNGSSNRPPQPDPDPFSDCNDHGTHVAGIVGANPYRYNMTGVAPDAQLEMYRVFGCSGGATTDVGVNASLQAFNSGADIISASIGSTGGWSDDAWAVVAERINANGRVYVISAGNGGNEDGTFAPNALGGGPNTLMIGSVDNTDLPALLKNATYRIENQPAVDFQFSPGFPVNFAADLELYALSFEDEAAADACERLPASTPDLTNRLVLVRRLGTRCRISVAVANVQRAGGRYILLYQASDDNPLYPLSFLTYNGEEFEYRREEDGPLLQGIGMVGNEAAKVWIDNLKNGTRVTVTLPTTVDNKELSYQFNNQTGGRMSRYSSWCVAPLLMHAFC
ncbi:Peptidase S8/S53 subtilisin/kexin/sedolisin [Macrophomina phaseolina MS6]|uniref:Peptidase S8/S53 subtilisin/kexin/sedolisin n=1 Tax=Macrophomina phaseolina (strain MS6) TaxID=1126212 RepID=K2S9Z1_MACPH|nr:Peptidase S8/S53 subtilisin/kexin/sedolisin [Macrophomina phaseolina MS6]